MRLIQISIQFISIQCPNGEGTSKKNVKYKNLSLKKECDVDILGKKYLRKVQFLKRKWGIQM